METLPNIDINIKSGNSLISRFPIDSDLKSVLFASKNQSDIVNYKNAVRQYFEARNKQDKKKAQDEIKAIKDKMNKSLKQISPKQVNLSRLEGELSKLEGLQRPFSLGIEIEELDAKAKKLEKDREKKIAKLSNEIDKLKVEIEEVESGRLYENALEWRFEFPEVLNDDGDFVGFDVVIGNPPYGVNSSNTNIQFFTRKTDSYQVFTILSSLLLKKKGIISQIIPNSWMSRKEGFELRVFLLNKELINIVDFVNPVFDDVSINTCILISRNNDFNSQDNINIKTAMISKNDSLDEDLIYNNIPMSTLRKFQRISCSITPQEYKLIEKIISVSVQLESLCKAVGGYKPYQIGYGKSFYGDFSQTQEDVKNHSYHSNIKLSNEYFPDIKGTNIHQYCITYNNQWVKWGDWLMSPKKRDYFTNPKIIVREIIDKKIVSALDLDGYFTNDTTHLIINKSVKTLKYVLGIINSTLIAWFFKKYFSEKNDLFPKIKINELNILPIVPLQYPEANIIISIVDQILVVKKANLKADTTALEKEIDQLVYKLYQLTYEEVKIIDPEFELTEQEYTAIKIE